MVGCQENKFQYIYILYIIFAETSFSEEIL